MAEKKPAAKKEAPAKTPAKSTKAKEGAKPATKKK